MYRYGARMLCQMHLVGTASQTHAKAIQGRIIGTIHGMTKWLGVA